MALLPGAKKECYILFLSLADTEHFCAARGAGTLGRRPLVLQRRRFGVFHFNFLPAFHAISLH
jgi:hypothetical protein